MKIRLIASSAIFLGSYLPLAIILLAQDAKYSLLGNGVCWRFWKQPSSCAIPLAHPALSLTIVGICFISFCLTLVTLSVSRPKVPIKVIEAKYIPAELMSYTLPYIVSFMSVGYQEMGKFVGILIFLVWMFWITHKSGQILLNPLLTVFGWRLYEIKYAVNENPTVHNGRALAREAVEPDCHYRYVSIQDILILRTNTFSKEK